MFLLTQETLLPLIGFYFLVLCRSETPQLFTVLPEKRTATVGGAMMGSTHIYDMSTVSIGEHCFVTEMEPAFLRVWR
jgi:hypothetical protein